MKPKGGKGIQIIQDFRQFLGDYARIVSEDVATGKASPGTLIPGSVNSTPTSGLASVPFTSRSTESRWNGSWWDWSVGLERGKTADSIGHKVVRIASNDTERTARESMYKKWGVVLFLGGKWRGTQRVNAEGSRTRHSSSDGPVLLMSIRSTTAHTLPFQFALFAGQSVRLPFHCPITLGSSPRTWATSRRKQVDERTQAASNQG